MKYLYYIISLIVLLSGCTGETDKRETKEVESIDKVESLLRNLHDPYDNKIMVVVHRGDWRNAPENSLRAIQSSIDMGADMVEIDVRMTKDSVLVLMHDETIDRTTDGKGLVTEILFEEISKYHLRDGTWQVTGQKIPTLKEALMVAKGKILINLDKAYPIFDLCYDVAVETGTLDQIVIKGTAPRAQVEKEFGQYLDKIVYMPLVRFPGEGSREILADFLKPEPPVAIEFTLKEGADIVKDFRSIKKQGTSIWVNSLWAKQCLGHDDEKAAVDPEVYSWFIDNGIDIIQTDRPQLLLKFLRSKGLHD